MTNSIKFLTFRGENIPLIEEYYSYLSIPKHNKILLFCKYLGNRKFLFKDCKVIKPRQDIKNLVRNNIYILFYNKGLKEEKYKVIYNVTKKIWINEYFNNVSKG